MFKSMLLSKYLEVNKEMYTNPIQAKTDRSISESVSKAKQSSPMKFETESLDGNEQRTNSTGKNTVTRKRKVYKKKKKKKKKKT